MFVGWQGAEPVAIAAGYRDGLTVGVMGVGVVPAARGRGIGSAMTLRAARAFTGADLAWLHPSDEARSMYERLGFVPVSDWEVWVRGPGAAADVEAEAARLEGRDSLGGAVDDLAVVQRLVEVHDHPLEHADLDAGDVSGVGSWPSYNVIVTASAPY